VVQAGNCLQARAKLRRAKRERRIFNGAGGRRASQTNRVFFLVVDVAISRTSSRVCSPCCDSNLSIPRCSGHR